VAGQRAFVEFSSPTLRSECGLIILVNPGGTPIDEGCLDKTGHGTMGGDLLRTAGRWKLRFDPREAETGALDLTLIVSTDLHITPPLDGSPVTVGITTPGQVAMLDFDGVIGRRVLVEITGSTLPAQCGVPSLVTPGGSTAALGCLSADGSGLLDGTSLTTTGRFTVVVDPAEAATGQLTLRLIVTDDQRGTIAVGGPPVTATIARPGQVARFTFTATKGDKFKVVVTGATIPAQCGVPGVRDPLGSEFNEGCVAADGTGDFDFTAVSGGTYTVEVNPADLGTGTVTFRLEAVR
jgi:hypothetical protein